MEKEDLLKLLNSAWNLLEVKPKYSDFNKWFKVKDEKSLLDLEDKNNILGITNSIDFYSLSIDERKEMKGKPRSGPFDCITIFSIIATITDALCGDRLGVNCEEDGTIFEWVFTNPK